LTLPAEVFFDHKREKLKNLGFRWIIFLDLEVAALTRPKPEQQKNYPNQPGSNIFDLDPAIHSKHKTKASLSRTILVDMVIGTQVFGNVIKFARKSDVARYRLRDKKIKYWKNN